MDKKAVAILCSGGPAPGINTVVATIARRFLDADHRVIGINRGAETLFTDDVDTVEIDFDFAERIYMKGGSTLKMSRYKPKDDEFKVDFFVKNNVKLLVTIGGDDTASTANRIAKFLKTQNVELQNIHVPKTIDNDLPLPGRLPTFGFQSAKNEGVRIGNTVYQDARTGGNWFVVSTMGREAGHLAFGIGAACHYPMIIIPEMFGDTEITFDKIMRIITSSMVKRKLMGIPYGVVAISEGVFHFMKDSEILNSGINFTYDEHGHPELGNVSKAHIYNVLLQRHLKKLGLKIKSRPVEVGYEVRCSDPISFDLKYCTLLGAGVKKLYEDGETGCIVVAHDDGRIEALRLEDVEDEQGKIKPRLVDVSAPDFDLIFNGLQYVREADYAAAKRLLPNPAEYDVAKIIGRS